MPSDIVRAPAQAYAAGSEPSYQGSASDRLLHQSAAAVTQIPGADGVWNPDHCTDFKRDGSACRAHPVRGEVRCYGHLRAYRKSHPEE